MKKILIFTVAMIFGLAGIANAITIMAVDEAGVETQVTSTWTAYSGSPSGGTEVNDINSDGSDWEVKVGLADWGDAEGGSQTSGIYGAGTLLPEAYGYKVYFDFDGYTWDSYNDSVPTNPGASDGYWDVFAVNINQEDYYWNQVTGDPIVSPDPAGNVVVDTASLGGTTWAWGGLDYAAGFFEEEHDSFVIELMGDDSESYYISAVLDTATSPNADSSYPSWGAFNAQGEVTPPEGGETQDPPTGVPEPATMLLLGFGMLGIAGFRRKIKK